MVKTSLLAFAVVAAVSSPSPIVLQDGFKSVLECNNHAVQMSSSYIDVGCVGMDENGLIAKFEVGNRRVQYIYGHGERKPDVVIESRGDPTKIIIDQRTR